MSRGCIISYVLVCLILIQAENITWPALSHCLSLSVRQKHHIIWWFQLACQKSRTSLVFCLCRGNYSASPHWKSLHPIFVPPTLTEWETSDLSLLYFPDAPVPLGNEILYYVYHALHSSARRKTNRGSGGRSASATERGSHVEEGCLKMWWVLLSGLGWDLH